MVKGGEVLNVRWVNGVNGVRVKKRTGWGDSDKN